MPPLFDLCYLPFFGHHCRYDQRSRTRMSKKKKRRAAKRASDVPKREKPAPGTVGPTKKAKPRGTKPEKKKDHARMDGIAERLQLGAQALRADVDTLLKEVRKGGVKPSAKARKVLAAVASDYRKAAKGLKKLSSKRG